MAPLARSLALGASCACSLACAGAWRDADAGTTPPSIDAPASADLRADLPGLVEDAAPPLGDFPADPVIEPGAPPGAPELFAGAARSGAAPCIVSPQIGTLMPRNWLRPRVELRPAAAENLFEIQLVAQRFATPLRIYTTSRTHVLDAVLWSRLRTTVNGEPIEVMARAMQVDSAGAVVLPPGDVSRSSFTIAPVDAPGKIVYWALAGSDGSLKGFGIGEEGVRSVLATGQVAEKRSDETCIGCHTATPDGESVGFSLGWNWLNTMSDIRDGTAGSKVSYITAEALSAIRGMRGIVTYSKAHWSAGDRVAVLADVEINWVQLDGVSRGVLARTGDTWKATEASFSHDGTRIAYVAANNALESGHAGYGPMDIRVIPYADRAGGVSTALGGASDPGYNEFYPAYSPDDALIAFTRFQGTDRAYSNRNSEIYFVPAGGGTAVRLAANDAASCQTELRSPGLTNSWPKWSPAATVLDGKTYYWLTFSSSRTGKPQLYVTALVADGAGVTTYPALYLWNQPPGEGNHSPSWDNYQIPPVIP